MTASTDTPRRNRATNGFGGRFAATCVRLVRGVAVPAP